MLLQLWEQWLGPAACCSSSTNSPGPSPCAAGDEFPQPPRARTQKSAASQCQHCTSGDAALDQGTDTPNSHPQPRRGEPFIPTSFVSLWHVTPARRCRQLGPLCAEPRQVSHGQRSQPGTATLEQNWSRAVHRQFKSHPKQIWLALKVPSCHPWQMLHRHPELCDWRPHAPLEARTLGSYTAPGKTHLGSWGTERRYPSNCILITQSRENRGKSQGCRISCRSKMGKPRGVGFAVGEGTWEILR